MMLFQSWFTPDELAKRLGLRTDTLAQWRVKGQGPGYLKIGKEIRYVASAVEAWLQRCYKGKDAPKEPKQQSPRKRRAVALPFPGGRDRIQRFDRSGRDGGEPKKSG